jgi:hypothetical protein
MKRFALYLGMLGLVLALVGPASAYTLGTITGGTGTVAGGAWSFSGTLVYDPLAVPIFGNPATLTANSAGGVAALDYDGYTQTSVSAGTHQFDIAGYQSNSIFYGNVNNFSMSGSTLSTTLATDGYIHWFYGFDSYLGPPPGKTSLASWGLSNDLFMVGTFTMTDATNFTFDATVNAVPIPGALVLLGAGLVRLVGYSRRKKAQI